jgi:hypothetical protein
VVSVDGSALNNVLGDNFVYAKRNSFREAIWPILAEKALAKVKGSYAAMEGGFNQAALSLWTGVPVMSISGVAVTTTSLANYVWNLVKVSGEAQYPMTAGTAGSGND